MNNITKYNSFKIIYSNNFNIFFFVSMFIINVNHKQIIDPNCQGKTYNDVYYFSIY